MMDSLNFYIPVASLNSNCPFVASAILAPLVIEVVSLIIDDLKSKAGRHDLLCMLATMVLCKGLVYGRYSIRFYSKQYALHEIFVWIVKRLTGKESRPSYLRGKDYYVTQVYDKSLVKELLSLSPTYSKDPNSPLRPTITYLNCLNREMKTLAVRMLFSLNGTISPVLCQRGEPHLVKPHLGVGYTSPVTLLEEYRSLLREFDINLKVKIDKRLKNRGFLDTYSWKSVEQFYRIGGFIDGVVILRGKYKGVEKNIMLKFLMNIKNHKIAINEYQDYLLGLRKSIY